MVELRGARIILRDKQIEDAGEEYMWVYEYSEDDKWGKFENGVATVGGCKIKMCQWILE